MVSVLLTAEGTGAERGSDMQEGGWPRKRQTAPRPQSASVRSSANVLDLHLAYLEELGGPAVTATNPEQLFAAGDAACFENALFSGCERTPAPMRESGVAAHVTIGRNERGFFELAVKLEISVPDRDQSEIEEFARIAHGQVCPCAGQ